MSCAAGVLRAAAPPGPRHSSARSIAAAASLHPPPSQPHSVPAAPPRLARRTALASLATAAGLLGSQIRVPPALAEPPALEAATFAGGNFIFLEAQFDNLRYAGVKDVVVGYVGPDRVRAVRVVYDPARIGYDRLLKEFWKGVRPTQADGQFESRGPAFVSAVWAATPAQRAAAERTRDALARSGVFGTAPGEALATLVLDGPADGAFEPAPEAERGLGKRDPKKLEELRKKTGRTAYFESLWGLSTFCQDRVCGYVRFAKSCRGECLDVFDEFREQYGQYAK